uniref:Uncharacterized protein n=1 Tax=Choristoneura fumiferana granulovirus TaxID=56947 RepID=Q8B590_GVCF|nr:unknown [Choristoneura fumiferana granulovirus]
MKRSVANWLVERHQCTEKEKRLRNLLIVNSGLIIDNGKWLDKRLDLEALDTEVLLVKVLKALNEEKNKLLNIYKDDNEDIGIVNSTVDIPKNQSLEVKRLIMKRPKFSNVQSVQDFITQMARTIMACNPNTSILATDFSLLAINYGLGQNTTIQNELHDLKVQNEKLTVDINTSKKEYDSLNDTYEHLKESYTDMFNDKNNELNKCNEELSICKEKIKKLSDHDTIETELKTKLEKDLEDTKTKLEKLEKDLDDIKEKNTKLEKDLDDIKEKNTKLKKENTTIKKTFRKIYRKKYNINKRFRQIKKRKYKLKKRFRRLRKHKNKIRKHKNKIRKRKYKLKKRKYKLKKRKYKLKKRKYKLETQTN